MSRPIDKYKLSMGFTLIVMPFLLQFCFFAFISLYNTNLNYFIITVMPKEREKKTQTKMFAAKKSNNGVIMVVC